MRSVLAGLIMFVSTTALAYNEAERCRIDLDPYAVPAYVPGFLGQGKDGPVPNMIPLDTGKCVMQDQFRPVLTLTSDEVSAFGLESQGRRVVANVHLMDGWYVARGHSETRVFFDEPVYLVPQQPPQAKMIQTMELMFTANPTGVTAADRDEPIKTFDGSLLQARGIHTRESRLAVIHGIFNLCECIGGHASMDEAKNCPEAQDKMRMY